MESVKYLITEEDIKNYLNKHSKDELIKYREALFVKYMKHQDIFSQEKIEILVSKSNNSTDLLMINDYSRLTIIKHAFYSFRDFLRNQQVDTSAYMHIIIPTLGLYKDSLKDISLTNGHVERYLPSDLNDYDCGKLTDTIENYTVAGKIIDRKDEITRVSDINMSENECNQELIEYSMIYGNEIVEKIKKLVKEG